TPWQRIDESIRKSAFLFLTPTAWSHATLKFPEEQALLSLDLSETVAKQRKLQALVGVPLEEQHLPQTAVEQISQHILADPLVESTGVGWGSVAVSYRFEKNQKQLWAENFCRERVAIRRIFKGVA